MTRKNCHAEYQQIQVKGKILQEYGSLPVIYKPGKALLSQFPGEFPHTNVK